MRETIFFLLSKFLGFKFCLRRERRRQNLKPGVFRGHPEPRQGACKAPWNPNSFRAMDDNGYL
jgi:hypothetical protein